MKKYFYSLFLILLFATGSFAQIPNGTYNIQGLGSQLNIDGNTSSAVQISINTAANEQVSQQFVFTNTGNGSYTIMNLKNKFMLEVYRDLNDNGTAIIQMYADGSANQQWKLVATGTGNNVSYEIRSVGNKSINVVNGATSAGSKLQLWDIGTSTNQLWKMIPILKSTASFRTNTATINSVIFPLLAQKAAQQIKGLFYIQLNNLIKGSAVLRNQINADCPKWELQSADSLGQLWWVVQDYNQQAFLLVSALDGRAVELRRLSDKSNPAITVVMGVSQLSDAKEGNFIQFLKPSYNSINIPGIATTYGIRLPFSSPIDGSNITMFTQQDLASNDMKDWKLYAYPSAKLKSNNTDPSGATFVLVPVGKAPGSSLFIPVPFQPSIYQTITTPFTEPGTTESVTKISSIGATAPTTFGQHIALSTLANVNYIEEDSLLRVNFNSTKAYLGWVSYEKTNYSLATFQSSSAKGILPRYGIGTFNDRIYVLKDGIVDTLDVNFVRTSPIFLGRRNGAFRISQTINNITSIKDYYDVALGSIMSTGIGSKLELISSVYDGSLNVSYLPGACLFSGKEAGIETPFLTSTNPDFPIIPAGNGTMVNNFDWRTSSYTLRYKTGGAVIKETAKSPFFYNRPEYSGISSKYTANGTHIGGEDNDPYSGWELIKSDLGFDNLGNEKADENLRNEPYMILYNRFLAKLRVFVYINNGSIANTYKVTLAVENSAIYGSSAKYKPPYLWDSFLRGIALDDENLSSSQYYKAKSLNSSSSGSFYYTDFMMDYDPCIAFFESSIRVSVDKVTNGTMQMVGRSLGGSIPGQQGINDWMQKNGNFMQGAMNQPYGTLAQTMGDMTMNNYKKWGLDSMANYAGFVLPGKKVEPWEKEAARLTSIGSGLQATGQFVQATGSLLKGTGEALKGVPLSGILDLGAPFKAAGEFTVAAGQFTQASGTTMIAAANEMRYNNLRDVPDKNIKVSLPPLQPSLVFSEIAMQGTLSIETPVLNDILITTPGSKNASYSPEYNLNGSKGSFPLYNEPLGLINLLNKPQFSLALVRAKDYGGYDCSLAIKEYPVMVANTIVGVSQMIPSVQIAITTYGIDGVASQSKSTVAYLQTNLTKGVPTGILLPARLGLNDLIDAATLEKNYIAAGGKSLTNEELTKKLAKWIKVELQMSLYTFATKLPNGSYGGSSRNIAYQSDVLYSGSISNSNSINGESFTKLDATYNLANNELFGSNHIFTRTDPAFASFMETYCNAHQKGSITEKSRISDTNVVATLPLVALMPNTEGLTISPNPASDFSNLTYKTKTNGDIHISLADLVGKKLIDHIDHADVIGEHKSAKINLNGLPAGLYLIKISFKDGTSYNGKVIKK